MALYKGDGTEITETTIEGMITEEVETDPWVTVDQPIYRGKVPDGTSFPEAQKMLLYRAGQKVRRSEITALFPDATITSVTPNTGLAAGGTAVTIVGTGFTPNATVKFASSSATGVKVVNDKKITCVSPAHAAGAVSVTVTTDSGDAVKANAFTYT